jgi:hypothetical protein
MKLNVVQQMLEGLYRISVDYAVEDFVITDPELARRLDASANPRENREKLLLAQQGDEVHLSLYLDAAILERLAEDCPLDALHGDNLEDFLLALEGVSHFLYVSWNAGFDRGVTLLELEMQAEVDKYVLASSLFAKQRRDLPPAQLWRCLFDSPSFDHALDGEERSRYADASHYAGRFCFQLEHQFLKKNRNSEMMTELRKFYRMTQTGKISHINTAYAA